MIVRPGPENEFVCPCLVCPTCGAARDVEDYEHPIDGLASCSHRRWEHEWWAVAGPFMDGRHMRSASERDEWAAHDHLVYTGVRR